MSRPLRIIKQNVTYHCYSMCIEKRDLLRSDFLKDIAIEAIKKTLNRYNFRLSYIEFVGNHFHIIIKTLNGGEPISKIMQYLKSRTSEIYNRRIGRCGPLWNDRYKSEIIEDYSHPQEKFIKLIWRISYNPVRKGLYLDPRDNPYSSIHVYLNQYNHCGIPLSTHEYYLMLGCSSEERRTAFEQYEKSAL